MNYDEIKHSIINNKQIKEAINKVKKLYCEHSHLKPEAELNIWLRMAQVVVATEDYPYTDTYKGDVTRVDVYFDVQQANAGTPYHIRTWYDDPANRSGEQFECVPDTAPNADWTEFLNRFNINYKGVDFETKTKVDNLQLQNLNIHPHKIYICFNTILFDCDKYMYQWSNGELFRCK